MICKHVLFICSFQIMNLVITIKLLKICCCSAAITLLFPADIGRELNVHKTSYVRLIYFLCLQGYCSDAYYHVD